MTEDAKLIDRLRQYSDPVHVEEFYMKRWDMIRKYIADGGRGSYPRDCFESFIDAWAQDASEAADRLAALSAENEPADAARALIEAYFSAVFEMVNPKVHADDLIECLSAKGFKIVAREPTEAMDKAGAYLKTWYDMWDAAP
jgi:hypothetical protein